MRRNPASLVHTQLTARRALAEPGSDAAAAAVAPDADDLELALRNHHRLDKGMKIWLGDGQEWPSVDTAILGWVSDLLTLDVNDKVLSWQWVGKEVELDVTYLYVESQPTQSTHWQVTNRLFFREFQDQVNEVYLQSRDSLGQAMERREMLNWDAPTLSWKPVPSDD